MLRSIVVCSGLLVASAAFARGSSHPSSSHGKSHSSTHSSSKGTGYGYANPSTETAHGYVTQRGTYVAPYHRTAPNHTKNDNFSTRGNYNPYTGKKGTKRGDDD